MNHKKEEFPEEFREQATSLRIESDSRYDRAILLAAVLLRLEHNYNDLKQNGFKNILTSWKKRCPQFGKPITIRQDDEQHQGIFEGLNEEGCLMLKTKNGELTKIVTGDLLF